MAQVLGSRHPHGRTRGITWFQDSPWPSKGIEVILGMCSGWEVSLILFVFQKEEREKGRKKEKRKVKKEERKGGRKINKLKRRGETSQRRRPWVMGQSEVKPWDARQPLGARSQLWASLSLLRELTMPTPCSDFWPLEL